MVKGRGGYCELGWGGGISRIPPEGNNGESGEGGGGGGERFFSTKSWYERERVICTGKSFLTICIYTKRRKLYGKITILAILSNKQKNKNLCTVCEKSSSGILKEKIRQLWFGDSSVRR